MRALEDGARLAKKVGSISMETRLSWIDPSDKVKVAKQCELAGVCRANWYNRQTVKPMTEEDVHLG